jgi:hypothetical protein
MRKPEGLCIADVCFPVREPIDVTVDGQPAVDLAAAAAAMRRPVVIDAAAGVAVLGASDVERADALKGGTAPDFTLPGIDGRTSRCRTSAAARECCTRTRAGEAAVLTCPCGRHSTKSSRHSA